jgi:hypothetical protein
MRLHRHDDPILRPEQEQGKTPAATRTMAPITTSVQFRNHPARRPNKPTDSFRGPGGLGPGCPGNTSSVDSTPRAWSQNGESLEHHVRDVLVVPPRQA